MAVPVVAPAAMVMVDTLQEYAAFLGSVTTTASSHALLSVAVTVLDVARVEPPTLDSQIVAGLALRVTVAR